jgi:hypothetical protein
MPRQSLADVIDVDCGLNRALHKLAEAEAILDDLLTPQPYLISTAPTLTLKQRRLIHRASKLTARANSTLTDALTDW